MLFDHVTHFTYLILSYTCSLQVIEEVAARHGLAALLHEKPFQVRVGMVCVLLYAVSE